MDIITTIIILHENINQTEIICHIDIITIIIIIIEILHHEEDNISCCRNYIFQN